MAMEVKEELPGALSHDRHTIVGQLTCRGPRSAESIAGRREL